MALEAQRARIRQGVMYNDLTPGLVAARERTVIATNEYNANSGQAAAQREALLAKVLGSVGTGTYFEPTFHCEFGYNITVGINFFANFDCILLDGADITIGDNVLFGPRVSVYTSNHDVVAAKAH